MAAVAEDEVHRVRCIALDAANEVGVDGKLDQMARRRGAAEFRVHALVQRRLTVYPAKKIRETVPVAVQHGCPINHICA